MKLKYLPYLLLSSVFSIYHVYAADLTKLNRAPNSKVLDNNWSGAYAGLQYSFTQNQYRNPWADIIITLMEYTEDLGKQNYNSINKSSYLAGFFAGYNQAANNSLIFGAEIDLSFKLNAEDMHYRKYSHPDITPESNIRPIELPLNRYLTGALRARLGLNLGKFLPYIAGGINVIYDLPNKDMREYADMLPGDLNASSKINLQIKIEGDDNLYIGYTLGTGVEYKTDQGLIVRAEYRYNNIISDQKKKIDSKLEVLTKDILLTQDLIITYGLDNLSSHDIRLGLGYHF
ncbi:outer membrane protein [Bartonella sp. DGB1]|uniref:outer membrane protein n=1 Tax=Bartonella sp. DGB1 TaxID=3239807 RepID=UPI0035237C38